MFDTTVAFLRRGLNKPHYGFCLPVRLSVRLSRTGS